MPPPKNIPEVFGWKIGRRRDYFAADRTLDQWCLPIISADTPLPMTSRRIATDVPTDVERGWINPRQNAVEARALPKHLL
jgi:hypothetical protein